MRLQVSSFLISCASQYSSFANNLIGCFYYCYYLLLDLLPSNAIDENDILKPKRYKSNQHAASFAKIKTPSTTLSSSRTTECGNAKTQFCNYLQFIANLPTDNEDDSELSLDVMFEAIVKNSSSKTSLTLETDDKLCLITYPPNGSKFKSYKLVNSEGTQLTVDFEVHPLMWSPDGIYFCLQEMLQQSESQMRKRYRRGLLKDSIRKSFAKNDGSITRKYHYVIDLKHPVKKEKGSITFIPYVYT